MGWRIRKVTDCIDTTPTQPSPIEAEGFDSTMSYTANFCDSPRVRLFRIVRCPSNDGLVPRTPMVTANIGNIRAPPLRLTPRINGENRHPLLNPETKMSY
ncbi:hypothetical protein SAMN06295910_0925 [Allosphingosinicella indica]|uniref:Uncharacterized protein n=1 Tax=Allosphingosinicella indica TaxID=941907 RepID=A0A1X7G0Q2_9SPHN|nr:hypothetical protein SAMN06295910_0925 [Allosphingosinicella indica]